MKKLTVIIMILTILGLVGCTTNTTSAPSENTIESTSNTSALESATNTTETLFTLEELSTYNGKDGKPAYVAIEGIVYDLTDVAKWKNGEHNGLLAGNDLTKELSKSPHGASVLKKRPVVGKLEN